MEKSWILWLLYIPFQTAQHFFHISQFVSVTSFPPYIQTLSSMFKDPSCKQFPASSWCNLSPLSLQYYTVACACIRSSMYLASCWKVEATCLIITNSNITVSSDYIEQSGDVQQKDTTCEGNLGWWNTTILSACR